MKPNNVAKQLSQVRHRAFHIAFTNKVREIAKNPRIPPIGVGVSALMAAINENPGLWRAMNRPEVRRGE
jgi:hypothetical protein